MTAGYLNQLKLTLHPENIVARAPVSADLWLTDFCNQHCKYCRYDHQGGSMSRETFDGVLNALEDRNIKAITITGGGEPLLNRDIDYITATLQQHGLPYGINTNLSILPPDSASPVWLKVSLDAATAKEYHATRGGDYKETMSNITEFRRRHPETTLGLKCVVTKGPEQINRFYEAHDHLDVDYFHFAPLEYRTPAYNVGEQIIIAQAIEELAKQDGRITTSPERWNIRPRAGHPVCPAFWTVPTINHKGELMYCCHKPDEIMGRITAPAEAAAAFEKQASWETDPKTCDVPCRQCHNNRYLDAIAAGGGHTVFI